MSLSVTSVNVQRVAGSIGAEICGVQVGPDLPGPVVRQIRDALLEHKVVFFRGQHHLDDAAQAGFAQLFGELSRARRTKPGDGPESYATDVVSSRTKATVWHTDASVTPRPPAMTMLRPIVLPPYGGDTAWANAAAAYQRMGPDWRELADGLRALHSNNLAGRQALRAESAARSAGDAGQAPTDRPMQSRRDAAATPNKLYETEHPVVRVHPETGERALLLGAFAKTILGRPDSDRLITLFQKFVTALDNTVRWRWAPGDLGMWDNQSNPALRHRRLRQPSAPDAPDHRPR